MYNGMIVCFLVFFKHKVQYANGVHGRQPVVPVAALRLLLNGEGGVIEAAVFEVVLFGFLKLYHKAFAAGAGAVEVKNGFAIQNRSPLVFIFSVLKVLYLMALRQQGIQEADKQVFVGFFAKKFFEAKVGEGVDECVLHGQPPGSAD